VDLTELPGLDDLHHPTDAIARAQALAAEVWQAQQTYFLVNGSSAGVLAMVLAACSPGDVILAPRNAHASFYHALLISGAVPRFMPVTEKDGVPYNVTVDSVREAFKQTPRVKALFVTSPSYNGICADMEEISALARHYGTLLLLDEAHGSHLGFCKSLPPTHGHLADLRVQSWHKTLGALTPGAVLHQHSSRVDTARIRTILQWVQTSSPSYPLLLSLDAVRREMALSGERLAGAMAENALALRCAVGKHVTLLSEDEVRECGFILDYTKITVLTGKDGINGISAAKSLSACGIDVEMAQPGHILAMVGPGYRCESTPNVARALGKIKKDGSKAASSLPPLPTPEVVVSPREAFYSTARQVLPTEAAGHLCAGMVTCFPPGMPVLAPGERVTEAVIQYIEAASHAGVTFRGLDKGGRLPICVDEV
jgi:arginine/lysine/ornithine decarboxylase